MPKEIRPCCLHFVVSLPFQMKHTDNGPVHPAYNLYFSACFFSWNSIFLSQQISQQCFSADLSAQPNGANIGWN
jgi:hypothetical protein